MKLYNVEVKVREGDEHVWRKIRPSGDGLPYLFTEQQATQHIAVYSLTHPGAYRMVDTGKERD